jgi:Ion channel
MLLCRYASIVFFYIHCTRLLLQVTKLISLYISTVVVARIASASVTTTITTIGYGPLVDAEDDSDHNFFSVYFMGFVLPFLFIQLVVAYDAITINTTELSDRIKSRCRRNGDTPGQAFVRELFLAVVQTVLLLWLLISLGTVCYRYFAEEEDQWHDGVFYAITSATSIGYGSFDVDNDIGYYAIGVYAIACNYTIGLIFPKLACFFTCASENIAQVNQVLKRRDKMLRGARDNSVAVL